MTNMVGLTLETVVSLQECCWQGFRNDCCPCENKMRRNHLNNLHKVKRKIVLTPLLDESEKLF